MVHESELDQAILSVIGEHWMKIAMLIGKVVQRMNLPQDDTAYNGVALRIETLVQNGSLLAQGNTQKWRHSEVRKPR
jgi:hypothetical protein